MLKPAKMDPSLANSKVQEPASPSGGVRRLQTSVKLRTPQDGTLSCFLGDLKQANDLYPATKWRQGRGLIKSCPTSLSANLTCTRNILQL